MSENLRRYQVRAVASMNHWLRDPNTVAQLVTMATGTGKTHTAHAFMADNFNPHDARVLWLAHTGELIKQARETGIRFFPGLKGRIKAPGNGMVPGAGIVKAERNSTNARYVYATVQTMSQEERIKEYLSYGFPELIVLDEAHHAVSITQQNKILKTVAFAQKYGDFDKAWELANNPDDQRTVNDIMHEFNTQVHVLGLTATPKRTDGISLRQVFDRKSFEYTLPEAVNDGYLKNFEALSVETQLPFADLRVTENGEFVMTDLVSMLEVNNWVELVRDSWLEKAPGQPQTIVFMPSVDMSRRFAAEMNVIGVPTCHVDFATCIDAQGRSTEESGMGYARHRQYVLDQFQNGTAKMLAGFSALLEGFDSPTDCVLWARPTKSDVVLTQGIGRGLRTAPGVARQLFDNKKDSWLIEYDDGNRAEFPAANIPFHTSCMVLDFVDVEASLLTTASLFGDLSVPAKKETVDEEDLVETVDIHDEGDLAKQEHEETIDSGFVDGHGKLYKWKSLFATAAQDFFSMPNGTSSARLGDGRIIFIYPRQTQTEDQLRDMIRKREDWLERAQRDQDKVDAVQEEIDRLTDLVEFFSQFSIWRVTAPVTKYADKLTGEERQSEQWWDAGTKAELVGLYPDGVMAFQRALPYADMWTSDEQRILVEKNQKWHYHKPSAKQLQQLKSGFVATTARKYGITMPSPAEIDAMNRGDASALRNHILAYAQVKKHLDRISNTKHMPADIWLQEAT